MQERVRELELNYKKYKRKKALKASFFGIFLILCGAGIYFSVLFYQKKNALFIEALEQKKELEKRLELSKIEQEKSRIFKEKMQEELEFLKQNEEELKENHKIQITSSTLNAPLLKKAFYQNPSFEKALAMARIYFENKDYKKCIFWALKANELDSASKETWFLFSRAKEALGENEDAHKAVQFYEEYYGFLGDKE